jgi:ribosomal protein L11 methyltransferase
MSDGTLETRILEMVTGSPERLTPLELKRRVGQACQPRDRGRIESAIKRLVEQKELAYTYQFGHSFLEPSFEKPVRVTNAMVLKPPACDYDALPDDVVLTIKAGAAFGTGCHPTTRLSLMGLEKVFTDYPTRANHQDQRVLDIGTGSGVLAIAALKRGLDRGIGLDIDPCARFEAAENAALNGLSKRLEISDRSLDTLEGRFFLITANLRLPTLKAYFNQMARLIVADGFLVVSGITSNEIMILKDLVEIHTLRVCWEGEELGWGALVLRQKEEGWEN